MDRRRIRLRKIWSTALRCDPRQPAASSRQVCAPARGFHLAVHGAGCSSNRGRLDHGDRDVRAGYFPTLRASDIDGPGAGDEYASLIVILLGRAIPSYDIRRTQSTFERRTKMSPKFLEKQSTRREMLRNSAGFAGSIAGATFSGSLLSAVVPGLRHHAATAPTERLAAMRAQMGSAPIQSQPLAEKLTLLSGPGGNVVVLNGPDGKIVVDTFLMPAWPKLKETLDGLGNAPLKTVIDTHCHVDPRTITPICTPRAPQCWPTKTPRRAWQSRTTVHFSVCTFRHHLRRFCRRRTS